jgi:hypothetical protein
MERILKGDIDPSFVITRATAPGRRQGPRMRDGFQEKTMSPHTPSVSGPASGRIQGKVAVITGAVLPVDGGYLAQ